MNRCNRSLSTCFLAYLLASGLSTWSQDTTAFKFSLDSLLVFPNNYISLVKFEPGLGQLSHSPDDEDEQIFTDYRHLLNQRPTLQNHENYFKLACSLWELNKLKDAERLFLNIINSTGKYYTTTYHHSSGTTYGYGSFTSNYKNNAALYLTRIYLEQKKFSLALKYLENATKKYKVTYTCGTGYHRQKDEYDFLYACCYEGLRNYQAVLDLLLPESIGRQDEIVIRAIQKLYTTALIRKQLLNVEQSLRCVIDTFPSYSWLTSYSNDTVKTTDTIVYYSGSATIRLFGRKVPVPGPRLNDGEHITREHFLKEFKESSFYRELAKLAGIPVPKKEQPEEKEAEASVSISH